MHNSPQTSETGTVHVQDMHSIIVICFWYWLKQYTISIFNENISIWILSTYIDNTLQYQCIVPALFWRCIRESFSYWYVVMSLGRGQHTCYYAMATHDVVHMRVFCNVISGSIVNLKGALASVKLACIVDITLACIVDITLACIVDIKKYQWQSHWPQIAWQRSHSWRLPWVPPPSSVAVSPMPLPPLWEERCGTQGENPAIRNSDTSFMLTIASVWLLLLLWKHWFCKCTIVVCTSDRPHPLVGYVRHRSTSRLMGSWRQIDHIHLWCTYSNQPTLCTVIPHHCYIWSQEVSVMDASAVSIISVSSNQYTWD